MKNAARRVSLVFGAGVLGGFVNSLAVWAGGAYEIAQLIGVRIAPALTPTWLYPRLVWGGIWGGLFLLPLLRSNPFKRGLLLGLGPTIVQLFVIFPSQTTHGQMGLALGTFTPLVVVAFNSIWGISAALWLRCTGE
jgi:hypothetical protein